MTELEPELRELAETMRHANPKEHATAKEAFDWCADELEAVLEAHE